MSLMFRPCIVIAQYDAHIQCESKNPPPPRDLRFSDIFSKTASSHNKLEIHSMERGICPIAAFYFALKRTFFNI